MTAKEIKAKIETLRKKQNQAYFLGNRIEVMRLQKQVDKLQEQLKSAK